MGSPVPMAPVAPNSTLTQTIICSMVLVGEYGILFVAAVLILTIVCVRSTSRLRTRLVYFYVITIIISLLRVVGYSLEPWWKLEDVGGYRFLHNVIFTMPAMLLITTYTILISYWADEYIALRNPHRRVRNSTRKRILIGLNVLLYAIAFVILSISLWPHTTLDLYHAAQSYFLNILYIISIVAFLLYGFGLYMNWKHTPIARKSQTNLRRMRLTLFITIIVTVSFAARVVKNALWTRFILHWTYKPTFDAVFYSLDEALPMGILLCLMLAAGYRFNPNKHQNTFKPLIAQVHDEGSGYLGHGGDMNGDDDDDDGVYESDSGSDLDEAPGGLFD